MYINNILGHLANVLSNGIQEDAFTELVGAMKRFINNYSGKDVFDAPHFYNFLEKIANFSLILLQNKNVHVWAFWYKIS